MTDPFIWTTGGRRISLVSPTVDDVAPEIVAPVLARINRWNGHLMCDHYSVAQHLVICSYLVPLPFAKAALCHDVQEIGTGDISSPMKQLMRRECPEAFGWLDAVAGRFDLMIEKRYGVELRPMPREVKIADGACAVLESLVHVGAPESEVRAHFGDALFETASRLATALPASVGSMLATLAPRDAERAWLERLDELGGTQ